MGNLYQIITTVSIVLGIYLIFRLIYLFTTRKYRRKTTFLRELLIACLVAYSMAMIILLFLHNFSGFSAFMDKGLFNPIERIKSNIGINLVPFKSISDFINYEAGTAVMIRNIFGNILLFTPISFLIVVLWPKWCKIWRILLFSIFVPAGIEFIQLFIGRAVDVDDVILNFTGFSLGFIIGSIVNKINKSQ